jgi:hypothetical protein
MSVISSDKNEIDKIDEDSESQIDLLSFHERHAGRLVVDPQ